MASTAPFDIGTLITCTPGVYGGRPCLAGTRFPVSMVAAYVREGIEGLAELFEAFPFLDPTAVHAAVTYYLANQADIDRELDEDRAFFESLEAEGR